MPTSLFWGVNIKLPTLNEIRLTQYIFSFSYDSFGILPDKWDNFSQKTQINHVPKS